MKELVQFQIEVAICMAALALLYLLLWRKETNFHFKRFLLLSIPLLSVCIPMLDIKLSVAPKQISSTINAMEYITYIPSQKILETGIDAVPQSNSIGVWQVVFCLWSIGTLIMLIRLLISYWKILQIYRKSEVSINGDYRLINDPVQSFSFFNLIILNKSQAATESKEHILAHERAHSQHYHSIDVVLFETLKMLQWFNPFIWLLTRDSKQNMEFIADQLATASDHKEKYQYAIILHAANSTYQLLKSQFSKTNLKNRIIMMNQPNSHKIHKGKLLVFLPILVLLFMSFSLRLEQLDLKKEITELLPLFSPASSNSTESINFPLLQKVELSNENQLNAISGNPETLSSESQTETRKIEGTIKTEAGEPVIGCNIIIKGTHIGTISDGEGKFIIEVEPEHSELVFSYVGLLTEIVKINQGTNYNIVLMADPEYAGSSSPPLKGGKVVFGYPLPDSNGITIKGVGPFNEQPLFILDGKEMVGNELADINPNDIKSLTVLKDKSAIAIYGDNGVNGVILIETKDANSREPVYTDVTIYDDNNKEGLKLKTDGNLDFNQETIPIYFKDGVDVTKKEVEMIDPRTIDSIEVIKGKTAKEKYGKKGKNGVILIKMKE